MNWKLILQLSWFWLAVGITTVFVIRSKIEPAFWLIIFLELQRNRVRRVVTGINNMVVERTDHPNLESVIDPHETRVPQSTCVCSRPQRQIYCVPVQLGARPARCGATPLVMKAISAASRFRAVKIV